MPAVRYRVVVSGRVHGVFYRRSCLEQAVAAGVHGWVRNAGDGSVEAVLEGDERAVRRVLAWMEQGPPAAVVTAVEATPEPLRGERGFRIVR